MRHTNQRLPEASETYSGYPQIPARPEARHQNLMHMYELPFPAHVTTQQTVSDALNEV